jgi:GH25 family lysozyme M1 (1,4-beta-N-acetylmuramidase)
MTIFGFDMSHFDEPGLGTALAEGIAFVTHKAGGDRDDPELAAWWSGVRGVDPGRLLLGAYWVLLPGDPAGRADAFLSRLDAGCPGWRDRPFLLQADCEKWRGDPHTVPSKAEITAFCDRLVARMPKLRPVVYAPKWVYGNSLAGLKYPLWASSYVTGAGGFRSLYPGDSSSRWAPYSGQTPAILQYTSSATIGGQTTSDANAYRGTLAQLVALVAPGWTEEDDVTPEDIGKIADAVWAHMLRNPYSNADQPAGTILRYAPSAYRTDVLRTKVDALSKTIAAMAAGQVTEADIAALRAAVDQVDDNVLAALTGGTNEELAAALKAALGDRAAAVGALLAA